MFKVLEDDRPFYNITHLEGRLHADEGRRALLCGFFFCQDLYLLSNNVDGHNLCSPSPPAALNLVPKPAASESRPTNPPASSAHTRSCSSNTVIGLYIHWCQGLAVRYLGVRFESCTQEEAIILEEAYSSVDWKSAQGCGKNRSMLLLWTTETATCVMQALRRMCVSQ